MWFLPEKRLSYLLKKKLFRGYQTKPPRVRFAPSPTGHLHLGGLRTALYNYLFAKSRGGAFILRIEDTDQARKVAGAVEALERDLQWAGLQCDEGPSQGGPCAPYVQSERLEIYQAHAERLVEAGAAYRCFCSARRLAVLRRDAERAARPPRYDGRCRTLAPRDVRDKMRAGTTHCIRFKLTSAPECQSFEDLVYGRVAHDTARAEGDPVLLKTDGWPTYHLASVVDDRLMAVTHVLRGVEWQISTTKHLLLYKAFGWEAPRFGHLPLIVNADGAKLSKRQHDATVAHYRDTGVLPLALVSFLALAGGGFPHAAGAPVALRTLPELAREFQLERVSAHPTRLNAELLDDCGRLELQRQVHDAALCGVLADALRELVGAAYGERARVGASRERLCRVLRWGARRVSRLHQLLEPELAFLWAAPEPMGPLHADDPALVAAAGARLAVLSEARWEPDTLRLELQVLCEERGVRWPALARALRGALAGQARGPPVPDMLALLGRAPALDRLRASALPAGAADTQASPDTAAINR